MFPIAYPQSYILYYSYSAGLQLSIMLLLINAGRSPSKVSRGPARQIQQPETTFRENGCFDPPGESVGQGFVYLGTPGYDKICDIG